jgi:type II secretory pathway component GspD/PulD (secretin)
MRKEIIRGLALTLMAISLPLASSAASAQETKAGTSTRENSISKGGEAVFQVRFVVRELDEGKRANTRSYMLLVKNNQTAKLRVGNRVPYRVGENSYQYQDVGINIDCHVAEQENSLLLHIKVESMSVTAHEALGGESRNPVFGQLAFEEDSEIPMGKPTLIGALDDVDSNRRYEVEVTATKVR